MSKFEGGYRQDYNQINSTIMKRIISFLAAFIIIILLMISCKSKSSNSNSEATAPVEEVESYEEEFNNAGEAIAGYGDDERATIYEFTFSGQLYNDAESHNIVLKYVEFPVDDDDDGWFDVSGDYRYPAWQKDKSFSFEGRTNGNKLVLFTENSEMFDLVFYDNGYVLKGDWYKYKNNQERDRDKGLWNKHLQVQLKVAKN